MERFLSMTALLGFIVVTGVVVSGEPGRAATNQDTVPTSGSDTYYYHYQYDTVRLPNLLDINDSVALLSWVRLSRNPEQVSGSLVLRKESIDSFQRKLRDDPLRSVQHEYVVPHPEGWWSLHLSGPLQDPGDVPSVQGHFTRSARRFHAAGGENEKTTRWPYLAETLGQCGRELGPFFHVTLDCIGGPSSRSSTHSMSYAFFQKTGRDIVVIGDLLTGVKQLGPVIRHLYERDMRMMSLAYNQFSKNRRLYFVHFTGKGSTERLTSALKELVALTGD